MKRPKLQTPMILAVGVSILLTSPQAWSSEETKQLSNKTLSVATWNVEHLAQPVDTGCRPRKENELNQLQSYANKIDADIVGLQEVSSEKAVRLLYPDSDWNVFLSERVNSEPYTCRESGFTSTQQKVAYAVRKGIKINEVKTLSAFGLDNPGLRHGLEITLETKFGPMTILNLHLKSGCFVDDYSRADSEACEVFAKQVPVLDQWIEEKEKQNLPYIILGDFNHRLSAPYNRATRTFLSNNDDSVSSLRNRTRDLIGCHPYYPAPIDHIFVGHMVDAGYQFDAKVHPFSNMEPDKMLSDHCAVSLKISI